MILYPEVLFPQAVIKGGLHGRPRGAVGGIIYGGARSREGKVVTAREFVIPGDTDDPDVLDQRSVFKSFVLVMRYLTAECWQADYDRSIGQLPGFHSLMSVLLGSCPYATKVLVPPPATPLGNLHTLGFAPVTHGSVGGSITITWGTGLGINGTDADPVVVFLVDSNQTAEGIRGGVYKGEVATRVDGTIDIATGSTATDFLCACYFRGAGTALGNLSPVNYYDVTSL